MPRSSSSTVVPVWCADGSGWARLLSGSPPEIAQTQPGRTGYTGLFVAGVILPLMISDLMVLIWDCRVLGILLAKSWYGASVTPPLASVPMYVPPLKVLLAAVVTAFFTAVWMPFSTLVMKYL